MIIIFKLNPPARALICSVFDMMFTFLNKESTPLTTIWHFKSLKFKTNPDEIRRLPLSHRARSEKLWNRDL